MAVAGLLADRGVTPRGSAPEQVAYVTVAAVVGVVARALAERPEMLRDGSVAREVNALVQAYVIAS